MGVLLECENIEKSREVKWTHPDYPANRRWGDRIKALTSVDSGIQSGSFTLKPATKGRAPGSQRSDLASTRLWSRADLDVFTDIRSAEIAGFLSRLFEREA